MHRAWIIARHEYLVSVRRPGFVIMTAVVPVLGALLLLIGAFFGGQASAFFERQFSPEPGRIGVVDRAGVCTPILPEYRDRFRGYIEEEAGRAALQADEITILLIVPEDYVETGQVLIRSTKSGVGGGILTDSDLVRSFFIDHLLREKVEPALRKRLAHLVDPVLLGLDAESTSTGGPMSLGVSIMGPYMLGMLLTMTIFISSGYLLQSVAEEKMDRVIEIILSSVTSWELLAGKVLGLGALGLTQVVIWLVSALGLGGGAVGLLGVAVPFLDRPEVFVLGLVYYVLGFLVFAVLMASVGALGATMRESQQLAGIFSLAGALPLMLGGFLFSNPNATLARVLSWFPLTAPTTMMLRLPMVEVPTVDIVGSIVVLIVSIPAVLWTGSKVFRTGLLMYGKRPDLGQVWRMLRYA